MVLPNRTLPGGIPADLSGSSAILLGFAFHALHWAWVSSGISHLLASPRSSWVASSCSVLLG
eukprot:9513666-Heterocapsa_arctica.AAC.1